MKKFLTLWVFFACLYAKSQIYVNPLTNGRPFGSNYYLGDQINPSGNWYFNFEIGQASWNKSEIGIGQTADGTGWDWTDANYYEDGSGSNKRVRRNIATFRFTKTGTWFVTGRARNTGSDPWTYTDEGTWTNNTSLLASTALGSCSYFVVTPLENPNSLSYSCGAANTNNITLSWNKWNTKDIIILKNQTGTFTDPTQGTTYNLGNTIGGSEVIYRGSASAFTDQVIPGTAYYYKVYSENWSYYSSGTILSASISSALAAPATQTVDLYSAAADLSVSVAGANSYQWYRNSVDNNYGGTAIAGATSSTYDPPTGPSVDFNNPGTNYYYVITSTGVGSCDRVVSSLSTVTVNNSNVANWANIQFPKMEQDLYEGLGVDIFAQVYINGSTPGTGQAPNVSAWIGYSTVNSNPNTWTQWVPAVYNSEQSFREDFNDEYWIKDFGKDLAAGTYYVASRFQKDGGAYVYGGIDGTTTNESGGIYDGINYFNLKLKNEQTVTWTGTAWNNTFGPTIDSPAIIAGDATSPPSFSAKKLTINNDIGLTISDGQSVTLSNELINNNGTSPLKTLIVESGGNFIQHNATDANSGNIRVERDATVASDQYNFWSAPVSGQNLYTLYQSGNAVMPKKVFTYNTITDYYSVVNSGAFGKGVGYSVKGENFGNSNAVFFGVPHNGNAVINLNSGGQRYNLIGNPYASNVSAVEFYLENQSQIENTLWFWDNTGNAALSQLGSGYSGYSTNNFATYNVDSGIGNAGTGTQNNASKIPNGKIVVAQGFIVQTKSGVASPSVIFKNEMRTAETGVFFAKTNQERNAFWLQLIAPSGLSNSTAIIYKDNAQNTLDNFDSELASLSSDALYSLADNNSKKLSIQGRNSSQLNNDELKLGAQFHKDGVFVFALKDKQGIFANGQDIYLHDKDLNVYTNLQNGNYSFSAIKGQNENRFEIVYKENSTLGAGINDAKSTFEVYRDGQVFVIRSSKNLGKLELYSAAGILVRTKSSTQKEIRWDMSSLPSGIYIIKTENEGDVRTKKIIR